MESYIYSFRMTYIGFGNCAATLKIVFFRFLGSKRVKGEELKGYISIIIIERKYCVLGYFFGEKKDKLNI